MSKAISYLTILLVFFLLTSTAYLDSFSWVTKKVGSPVPEGIFKVGQEKNGTPVYLCRANYDGGLHPGRIVDGRCYFPYAGKEWILNNYEVLIINGGRWENKTTNLFKAGHEKNGTPVYLCKTKYKGSTQLGKMVDGTCYFPYAGKEIITYDYETFTTDTGKWENKTTNLFKAGDDKNGELLYMCRAKYGGGVHPGKIIDGTCHIPYGGKEVILDDYEVLAANTGKWESPVGSSFKVGYGKNGAPIYLCKANYNGNTYPGKIVNGRCFISSGDKEISVNDYQVFYPDPPMIKILCTPTSSHEFARGHSTLLQVISGWVRGKACLDTTTGDLTMVLGLETDSLTEGVKGEMFVYIFDDKYKKLATFRLGEIGIGSKASSGARIEEFPYTKRLPSSITERAAYIDVKVKFAGITTVEVRGEGITQVAD